MRSPLFPNARKWIGASVLAILVGLGGGSAFLAATSQSVTAQVQPTAEVVVPDAMVRPGFADLVDAVKPAVVSIVVESERAGELAGGEFNFNIPDLPDDSPFRDFFDEFGRQFGDRFGGQGGEGQQPPRPRQMMGAGSGFIISPDGYVVTNNHVVQDATKVTVVFDDGDERTATVIGTDERTDLALIKIEGENLPYVKWAESPARVGDWVVAVGNPFGLGGTVTAGIVSASGRDIGGSNYGDFMQIDAAVNTGNSGGPAFNLDGQVVGVNTAIYSPNGGSVGIAFAIPAATVKTIVEDLKDDGTVTRGFLGVGIQDVNRDLADSVGLQAARGALVTEPTEGGPAATAGIKSGDVIVAVDGDPITNALDLSRTIAGKGPDKSVEITLWRDGAEQKVSVTLGTLDEAQVASNEPAAPTPQPPTPQPSSVGLTLVPNAGGPGLLVQQVDPDSVAANKGIDVGDTILEVNNTAVASADEFESALNSVKSTGRSTALVKTERDGNVRFLGLPLDETQG
jgi:serine protease Do